MIGFTQLYTVADCSVAAGLSPAVIIMATLVKYFVVASEQNIICNADTSYIDR